MEFSFDGSKEMYISIVSLVLSLAGSYYILRLDWKRYGFLYLLAGVIGNTLCYLFVKVGFYSYPYIFLPVLRIPLVAILTAFSFYVILGVRYSPASWTHKIMFYGVLINTGVFFETVLKNTTRLIQYHYEWDLWDSYTTWWGFFILMEWLGGKIVPQQLRAPISANAFRFDNWFWFVIHIVGMFTVFLAGLYLGLQLERQ